MKILNKTRRNELIIETWGKRKNDWTMEDIAEIFGVHLKSIYRIIKKDNEQPKKENNTI